MADLRDDYTAALIRLLERDELAFNERALVMERIEYQLDVPAFAAPAALSLPAGDVPVYVPGEPYTSGITPGPATIEHGDPEEPSNEGAGAGAPVYPPPAPAEALQQTGAGSTVQVTSPPAVAPPDNPVSSNGRTSAIGAEDGGSTPPSGMSRQRTINRGSAGFCPACGQRYATAHHRRDCPMGPAGRMRAASAGKHVDALPVLAEPAPLPEPAEKASAIDTPEPPAAPPTCECPPRWWSLRQVDMGELRQRSSKHSRLCPLHTHRFVFGTVPNADGMLVGKCFCGEDQLCPLEPERANTVKGLNAAQRAARSQDGAPPPDELGDPAESELEGSLT